MFSALNRLIELDEQDSVKQRERVAFLSLMGSVIESLPDALVVTGADGKILFFNESAEFMFGYQRSEVVGLPVEILVPKRVRCRHKHDREQYRRFEINQRAQTMGVGMDLSAVRKDGHEFKVDITLSRMVSPQGVLALASIRCSPRASGLAAAASGPPGQEQEIENRDA